MDPSGHRFEQPNSSTCLDDDCATSEYIGYEYNGRPPDKIDTNTRGDEYGRQVKQAIRYCELHGCDTGAQQALRHEYQPFYMKNSDLGQESNFLRIAVVMSSVPVFAGLLSDNYSGLLELPQPDYQNPWQGEVFSQVLEEDTVMYRVWGGDAKKAGRWVTPIRPTTQSEARALLALPSENSAVYISEVRIPAGTRIQIGAAAPNFGQPGGALQVELMELIPLSAFGPGRALPIAYLPLP